ncbi:MAG: peroxiredoxin family protein [Spirosomataceae bacterium]
MKKYWILLFFLLIIEFITTAQSISGRLTEFPDKEIRLDGFNGFNSYNISTSITDGEGSFSLPYSKIDYGIGIISVGNQRIQVVILNGEAIRITQGNSKTNHRIETIGGNENKYFTKYLSESTRRENALKAWKYLDNIYHGDSVFSKEEVVQKLITSEINRLNTENQGYLKDLPEDSYLRWFIPVRQTISSASTIVQEEPHKVAETIEQFRKINYSDQKLYKSGLLKDAIESHFWLIENSGKELDSVFIEMNRSVDILIESLIGDEEKLNEITDFLFDLLERHSLFESSEYLAIKVLSEVNCTINSNLANQLETYRAMKKGNIAPDILFGDSSFLNGVSQDYFKSLSEIKSPYTLVVFGANWCPKCTEEIPKIINNYVKWKNLGLEVIYVSLETDRDKFKEEIGKYPFFTYCDFLSWDSPLVKNYYVFGTPTLFLLDESRKIVLRPNSVEQVDSWVEWFLKGGNK